YFGARIISGIVNYLLNSRIVFKSAGVRQAVGYAILWLVMLGLGMLGSYLIRDLLHWPGIVCKICVDLPLFLLSYFVQREVIFKKKRTVSAK
ncbi:MAG: GtrA family protein, partial [Clostridia bacterium]|nr:GtrA family protein [Clostridia bacterium]